MGQGWDSCDAQSRMDTCKERKKKRKENSKKMWKPWLKYWSSRHDQLMLKIIRWVIEGQPNAHSYSARVILHRYILRYKVTTLQYNAISDHHHTNSEVILVVRWCFWCRVAWIHQASRLKLYKNSWPTLQENDIDRSRRRDILHDIWGHLFTSSDWGHWIRLKKTERKN